jgi:hypothetical protein
MNNKASWIISSPEFGNASLSIRTPAFRLPEIRSLPLAAVLLAVPAGRRTNCRLIAFCSCRIRRINPDYVFHNRDFTDLQSIP